MQDRVTRAYYWAGLFAAMACFASLVVMFTIAAPGFNVQKDRQRVESLSNPAVAAGLDANLDG